MWLRYGSRDEQQALSDQHHAWHLEAWANGLTYCPKCGSWLHCGWCHSCGFAWNPLDNREDGIMPVRQHNKPKPRPYRRK